jgi:hypothetical protein
VRAIAHALLPPLDVPADSLTKSSRAVEHFWSHELPDDFLEVLQETIATKLSATESKKLKILLLLFFPNGLVRNKLELSRNFSTALSRRNVKFFPD